jgi:(E)-4-hydroxy-3-methylbut-2-enyl-diphosphate synthase
MPVQRRTTRQIRVGGVAIGGDAPISVQSMTTTKTADVDATLQQIASLVAAGVDIVRVAVPHWEDAEALKAIAAKSTVPVVADIHFQWKYAMAALEAGIQGLRINPGNIRYQDKVRLIAREAKARGVPIRIGVNAGSLEKDLLARYGSPTPEALVESALAEARILEDEDFLDVKISVKHSNPSVMIEAYRQLAEKCDYALHLGVTEAGPMPMGGIKSAVGIGVLLAEGIGDTIRVSLTDDPVEEVKAGTWILQSLGLRKRGLDLVACPSCGRAEVNVLELTRKVNEAIERERFTVPMRVAVMGCVVNGPGEARGPTSASRRQQTLHRPSGRASRRSPRPTSWTLSRRARSPRRAAEPAEWRSLAGSARDSERSSDPGVRIGSDELDAEPGHLRCWVACQTVLAPGGELELPGRPPLDDGVYRAASNGREPGGSLAVVEDEAGLPWTGSARPTLRRRPGRAPGDPGRRRAPASPGTGDGVGR